MYKTLRSFTHHENAFWTRSSELIVESPLEIIINADQHVLIMCTPGMIRELVVGFLFTEGLINGVSDLEACSISSMEKEEGEQVMEARVRVSSGTFHTLDAREKRISYSSCGICGKENYYELKKGLGRVKSRHRFSMETLKAFPARMEAFQPLYQKTGGAHAAILFDENGLPILHSEDMGRHNALDKVIGAALIKGISRDDKILVSSGRSSLEMILKTARAGIPLFVAMSRPTSRAVEAAKFYNITLIDLAKDTNRIYTHARRIKGF
jgi:FdhD protein